MQIFALISRDGKPFLRIKNPLVGSNLVSPAALDEHERLYEESALPVIDPIPGRKEYLESEVRVVRQFRLAANFSWQDVTGTEFINTIPTQYRQAFRLVPTQTYQMKTFAWVVDCFGKDYANDVQERTCRYLEESLEFAQSLGITKEEVLRQVIWTFGRPAGDPAQEAGGCLFTLASLCAAANIEMQIAGEETLEDNIRRPDDIKIKHLLKQKEGIAK